MRSRHTDNFRIRLLNSVIAKSLRTEPGSNCSEHFHFITARRYAERGSPHILYVNSVRLSVTRLLCVKTAEYIEIRSLTDRPICLVFRHQGLLRKSDGFKLGLQGGGDFRGYISKTEIDA